MTSSEYKERLSSDKLKCFMDAHTLKGYICIVPLLTVTSETQTTVKTKPVGFWIKQGSKTSKVPEPTGFLN